MPEEFTPEEKKHLAESPADSATLIGDDTTDEQDGDMPTADEEPPAGAQA
jgi:hypothetical protein